MSKPNNQARDAYKRLEAQIGQKYGNHENKK
jgi:hypothetical protein